MGRATALFLPFPLGPWEVPKGQISLNFNYKVNFKFFLNQTLCVFSQLKDVKHIRQDFHLVAWVMTKAWDLGYGGSGDQHFFFFSKMNQIWCASYLHKWHMQQHHFMVPAPWGRAKRSTIIKSQLQIKSILKIFKPSFVCLLPNERYKTYQTGFSFDRLCNAPGVGLGGTVTTVGGGGGVNSPPPFKQIWCVS